MNRVTRLFNLSDESGVLRTSIAATVFFSLFGITFGILSGSFSIVFDGVYSLVDACMSLLSLVVAGLIAAAAAIMPVSKKLLERVSMGRWHLEPMVLCLNGTLLVSVATYALFNAVGSLLEGGRDMEFGWAILYTAVTLLVCIAMASAEHRANRSIQSDFVALDIKGWIMAGAITAALLIAFVVGFLVQGTTLEWISPYIEPVILAAVCLFIIPLPLSTIRPALADNFLVTPPDLKEHVDTVAKAFKEKHGLVSYRTYVARMGRCRESEIYFIVPADAPARTITEWDALRDEVGELIGDKGPDRWLTVVFTGDPEWAE